MLDYSDFQTFQFKRSPELGSCVSDDDVAEATITGDHETEIFELLQQIGKTKPVSARFPTRHNI